MKHESRRLRTAVVSLVTATCLPLAAWAQVDMYGVVDASLRYVDDVGGKSQAAVTAGDQMPNRLGFRGTEDLGDGMRANFVLESGFNIDTGQSGQGGLLFGRQALVGLGRGAHTVTLGRQYDAMFGLGEFYAVPYGAGSLAWSAGGLDRVAGERLDNSVKYAFKDGGLTVDLMTAFGEVPGDTTAGRALSGGFKYRTGGWIVGASATRVNNRTISPYAVLGISRFLNVATANAAGAAVPITTDHITNLGLGVSYDFGVARLLALTTQTAFETASASQTLRSYHVAANVPFSGGLTGTLGYTYQHTDGMNGNIFMSALNYYLSKRTDIYALAVHQRNSGDNKAVLFTVPVSGDRMQTAVALGVRHKF